MALDIIRVVFRYIHFLGVASVLGGLLVQLGSENKKINGLAFHGAEIQLLTGLVLTGVTFGDVDHIKVTVKLALLIVLFVFLVLQRRRESISKTAYALDLALVLAILGVAVFWRMYG